MVKFTTPPFNDRVDVYFFTSLRAIYSVFSKEQIGCKVNRLWEIGVGRGNAYQSKTCTITQEIIQRMPQKKGRKSKNMEKETKEFFLKNCKFYKGEDKCPFTDEDFQMFWRCEERWYKITSPSNSKGQELIISNLQYYMRAGLSEFEMFDKTPITLKAVLYNRFCKYNDRDDVDGFKALYISKYHKQKDRD